MIRSVLAACVIVATLAAPAIADTKDVYTITDIPVNATANTPIAAQDNAFAQARLSAAKQIISRITLAEDRNAAGGLPVDTVVAERLFAAVDVQEEVRSANRYRGVLSVVTNPNAVRAYLAEKKVPYVDAQAPLALMVPVATGSEQYAWAAAFPDRSKGSLSPYITARTGYSDTPTWDDVAAEARAVGAQRAIVARLVGRSGGYRVAMSSVTPSGTSDMGMSAPVPGMTDAVAAMSAALDTQWKEQSVVRGGARTLQTTTVTYTSLAEWNTLRGALSRSPLVSDFQISAFSRDGALVKFAFAGDAARLQSDLRQRGIALSTDYTGWVMTSAATGRRTEE